MSKLDRKLSDLEERHRQKDAHGFIAIVSTVGLTLDEAEQAIADLEAEAERVGYTGRLIILDR